jgi:hypothetical protein
MAVVVTHSMALHRDDDGAAAAVAVALAFVVLDANNVHVVLLLLLLLLVQRMAPSRAGGREPLRHVVDDWGVRLQQPLTGARCGVSQKV